MITKPIGLYIHVPFCIKKCNYCDFCSYPANDVPSSVRTSYVESLTDELRGYKRAERISVDTVFFGGGTPSLLEPSEIEKIFEAINESFDVAPTAEITIEMNPGTVSEKKLLTYKALGINRVSIGLQSIHENELKKLGRIHLYDEFVSAYTLAEKCGFDNISVDLMYGIPDQTVASFAETIDAIVALSPAHISAYGLILEEGTPLCSMRDSLTLPSEDSECDMYELACRKLTEAGYSHYEISNYARQDRFSRHNLHYWRREEYIGVGVAAHSYFEGVRFSNPSNLDDYLKGDERECETDTDAAFEYAMLALRLAEGISLSEYEEKFSRSFLEDREDRIKRYIALGYMTRNEDRLAFTDRGMYVSNAILSDLL